MLEERGERGEVVNGLEEEEARAGKEKRGLAPLSAAPLPPPRPLRHRAPPPSSLRHKLPPRGLPSVGEGRAQLSSLPYTLSAIRLRDALRPLVTTVGKEARRERGERKRW